MTKFPLPICTPVGAVVVVWLSRVLAARARVWATWWKLSGESCSVIPFCDKVTCIVPQGHCVIRTASVLTISACGPQGLFGADILKA